MIRRLGAPSRLAIGVVLLAVCVGALTLLGHGTLSTPPLGAPNRLAGWAADHDPAVAAFSILRVVALAAAWYLLAVTALHLLAAFVRSRPLETVALAVTLPVLRRALAAAAGASVTATATITFASTTPVASATTVSRSRARSVAVSVVAPNPNPSPIDGGDDTSDRPGTATMRFMHAGDPGTATMRRATAAVPNQPDASPSTETTTTETPSTATIRALPDAPAPNSPTPPSSPSSPPITAPSPASPPSTATMRALPNDAAPDSPAPPTQPPVPQAPTASASTTIAAPGDSFWSIAESTLHTRWDRLPTDDEVDDYWRALVAANQDRLAQPGQPDLIFAGQVFVLPPVSAAAPSR